MSTNSMITRRYIRLRTVAALVAVFVSAFVGHAIGERGRAAVERAATVSAELDHAHLAIAESALAFRELAAAPDPQRAESRRAELRRAAADLATARAALGGHIARGALGPQTRAIVENAAIDPLGVMDDLLEAARSLSAPGGPFGDAVERPALGGLSLARDLLPLLTRMKETERDSVAAAARALSGWGAAALTLTAALLVGLGVFVFLPLERRILAAQEEIEEKRRAAEAASEAKSAFLATMSHEIRTPMNGVLGMAELLRASGLDERQRRMAEIIASSGRALMAILDSVLQFSRIEAGKVALQPAPFDLARLVDEVAELFGPSAAAKGIGLTARTERAPPGRMVGDEGALRQILSNLVNNAIKFTESGRVSVTVADEGGDTAARRIAIAVSDTGVGVAPEAQRRIFESFEQADASTTRRFGGAGLGLAISRGLARAMGGEISVESASGEGATFVLRLTLPEAPPRAARDAAATAADAGPS